jgi:8-oxo-dGTP pyrophosphatase MutT (NUDIX family)
MEEGAALAKRAALNLLAIADQVADGDLERVRVLKLTVFVASDPGSRSSTWSPTVPATCSVRSWATPGVHARSAVGVPVLPLDSPSRWRRSSRSTPEPVVRGHGYGEGRRRTRVDVSEPRERPVPTPAGRRRPRERSRRSLGQRDPRPRRPGHGGLEVLLLERHLDADFAGGALVFPGGKVDEPDRELDAARWTGRSLARWREELGTASERDALGVLVAAIRETFEEAGVLLAHREDGTAVWTPTPCAARARSRRVADSPSAGRPGTGGRG